MTELLYLVLAVNAALAGYLLWRFPRKPRSRLHRAVYELVCAVERHNQDKLGVDKHSQVAKKINAKYPKMRKKRVDRLIRSSVRRMNRSR